MRGRQSFLDYCGIRKAPSTLLLWYHPEKGVGAREMEVCVCVGGASGLRPVIDVGWYLRGSVLLRSPADSCLGVLKGQIKTGVVVGTTGFICKNSTAEHLLGTQRTPRPW